MEQASWQAAADHFLGTTHTRVAEEPIGAYIHAFQDSANHAMPARRNCAAPVRPVARAEHFGGVRVAALAVVSTVAWLTITLLPYEVSTLSDGYPAGPVAAGWITAAELLALACAASCLGQTIAFPDKRRLTLLVLPLPLPPPPACLSPHHIFPIVPP